MLATKSMWPYVDWWCNPMTLDAPFDKIIKPGPAYSHCRQTLASNRQDVYCVLLTGRPVVCKPAVMSWLHYFECMPYRCYFKPAPEVDTLEYKFQVFAQLLQEFPQATKLEIWEDRVEHVEQFQAWVPSVPTLQVTVRAVVPKPCWVPPKFNVYQHVQRYHQQNQQQQQQAAEDEPQEQETTTTTTPYVRRRPSNNNNTRGRGARRGRARGRPSNNRQA